MKLFFTTCFLLQCMSLFAQDVIVNKQSLLNMKAHVEYLADDKLEGRLAGSKGEQLAIDYIEKYLKLYGLSGAPGIENRVQAFTFYTNLKYSGKNELIVKKAHQKLDVDFYPVPLSSNGSAKGKVVDVSYGIDASDLNHNDYQNVKEEEIFLLNLASPDGHHPHSKYLKYNAWSDRVNQALKHNPKAIILYNSEKPISIQALRSYNNISRVAIPVIYVEDKTAELIKSKMKVEFTVNIDQKQQTAHNVVAYVDNGADKSVVIGAHFDHLGYGEYGNSLYTGEKAIHNGADDNASGTALVLEMARLISQNKEFKQHNYIFIFFSAEELGLLGSNYFTNSSVLDDYNVSYMLNFDMVGRLENKENADLGITGTGTSSVWDSLLKRVNTHNLTLNTTSGGLGSSDHSSFYLHNVPAIHFFTGTHEDYHKPSDDHEKINYSGMQTVLSMAMKVCAELEDDAKLDFIKTDDGNSRKAPSFSVTLGIVPDYFGKDKGLKLDGVREGKPAAIAGMQKGDVIIRMADKPIVDMMSYMNSLKLYKKGDKIEVEVLRDGKKRVFQVTF